VLKPYDRGLHVRQDDAPLVGSQPAHSSRHRVPGIGRPIQLGPVSVTTLSEWKAAPRGATRAHTCWSRLLRS
jgi:hypothetical protein